MNDITREILPRSIVIAAQTFADKPAVVGEIVVALCTDNGLKGKKLTDVQNYVLASCLEEIKDRIAKRKNACQRKRLQRSLGVA